MGKSKKIKPSKKLSKVTLEEQMSDRIQQRDRIKFRDRLEEDDKFVEARLSQKILRQAREQQIELEEELEGKCATATTLGNISIDDHADDSDEEAGFDESDKDFYEDIIVDQEDEKALELFMNKDPVPRLTLADVIKEKITEKQTELQSQFSDCSINVQDIDPKVKEMYEGVKEVLSKYRSGKVPKAFKIIPKLRNWEQILYITEPQTWTAAAMYTATRIFASNLKEKMAQRFYNLVLLPRIRDDIVEYKRLNFHLYQALRKSLFKPAAFMKGFLIPLCESGTCTLREAIIIGSVLAKNSIPMLHSAATILKLAEMNYTGANSIFLRILFDKKYALPYRVIDASVFHFLRFEKDKRKLPVLWHQALLTFVQRYKSDISSEQKEALLNLLKHQSHPSITPEIRRELQHCRCRDEETPEPSMMES